MARVVIWGAGASRDMDRLAGGIPKMIPAIVEFIYRPLAENPARVGTPLIGELEGSHKAVVGAYRVEYSFTDTTVTIEHVDHRADVYRRR